MWKAYVESVLSILSSQLITCRLIFFFYYDAIGCYFLKVNDYVEK